MRGAKQGGLSPRVQPQACHLCLSQCPRTDSVLSLSLSLQAKASPEAQLRAPRPRCP